MRENVHSANAERRPPPVQPRSDDTRRHVGAGFGREPSINRRISAIGRRAPEPVPGNAAVDP